MKYERDPHRIYLRSFEIVEQEAGLGRFPNDAAAVVARIVHACGMPDICGELRFAEGFAAAGRHALATGANVICDSEMTDAGIIRRQLPAGNQVIVTLNHPSVEAVAEEKRTTRSAAAAELWRPHLKGSVVAIGTAPTALFRLLEMIDERAPRPALILGFPVGFVGAAESKDELASDPRDLPFLTIRGRRGGSAMASAAVNGLSALARDGTSGARTAGRERA